MEGDEGRQGPPTNQPTNQPTDQPTNRRTDEPINRAEALCFVYRARLTAREANAYDDGQGPGLFDNIFARVIVATRTRLQGFKHDDGTQARRSSCSPC